MDHQRVFEEKLFTVEENHEDHKQIDDKIQGFRDLVEESTRRVAKSKKSHFEEMEGRYVTKEEHTYLQEELN